MVSAALQDDALLDDRCEDFDSGDSCFEDRLGQSDDEGSDAGELGGPPALVVEPPSDHVDEPPLAPPLAGPPPPPLAVDVAWVTCYFPKGKVTWYRSKNAFQATCLHRGHHRCILTRTSNNSGWMEGRPMGLMGGWLLSDKEMTRDQHMQLADELEKQSGGAIRQDSRNTIKGFAFGPSILAKERPKRDLEPEEPQGKPEG